MAFLNIVETDIQEASFSFDIMFPEICWNLREFNTCSISHQHIGSASILWTNYRWITELDFGILLRNRHDGILGQARNILELCFSWLEYGVYKGASRISKFPCRIWSAPDKCQAVFATLPPIIIEVRKWVPPTVATGSWRYPPPAPPSLSNQPFWLGKKNKNSVDFGIFLRFFGFWDFLEIFLGFWEICCSYISMYLSQIPRCKDHTKSARIGPSWPSLGGRRPLVNLVFQVFSLVIGTMEVMLEEDRRMLRLLIVDDKHH